MKKSNPEQKTDDKFQKYINDISLNSQKNDFKNIRTRFDSSSADEDIYKIEEPKKESK